MKVKTVINGKVVELEGTPEEMKSFLEDKPQSPQQLDDRNLTNKWKELLDKLDKEKFKDQTDKYYPPIKYGYPSQPYFNPECTCNKAWLLVGPIPPCPVHEGGWSNPITYTITSNNGGNSTITVNGPTDPDTVFIPTIFTNIA